MRTGDLSIEEFHNYIQTKEFTITDFANEIMFGSVRDAYFVNDVLLVIPCTRTTNTLKVIGMFDREEYVRKGNAEKFDKFFEPTFEGYIVKNKYAVDVVVVVGEIYRKDGFLEIDFIPIKIK